MNQLMQHSVFQSPFLQRQHPLMPSIADNTIAIEDPRVVMRLVNNLKYLFNIGSGDYLTFVLGHGECSNNEQALKYWVLEQLADEPVGQNDVLNYLVEHLKHQINMEMYS